jgi:pilus assembly protein Flp/PilA
MLELLGIKRPHRGEDGASAVEYGLLVAGIAALVVAVVFVFGGVIKGAFQTTCNTVKTGSGAAKTC